MIYIQTQHEQGIKNSNGKESAEVGHFFLSWLVGPVLSKRYDIRYLYTNPVPEYMGTNQNQVLGFSKYTKKCPHYSLENIKNYKIIDLPRLPFPARYDQFKEIMKKYSCMSISDEDNIVLRTQPGQSLAIDWQYFLNNDLRERYDMARQKQPIIYNKNHDNNCLIISCHVRRGDLNPVSQSERYIYNEQYLCLFNNIKEIFEEIDMAYKIQIISVGEIHDFYPLNKLKNIEFLLNESPCIALDRLINADIFIPAKSAFSTLACYLNKNIKFIIPFSIYWTYDFPDNDNFNNLIKIYEDYNIEKNKLIGYIRG